MEYLKIENWGKYQHYKDRNPPWIKLYHSLLDDYEYACMQDDSKLLLISLFLLASRCENKIPADPQWIKNKCNIKGEVNLEPLLSNGFLTIIKDDMQNDSKMIASCQRNADSETETETEKRQIYQSFFDQFWLKYPKKIAKDKCQIKWNALFKGKNIEKLNQEIMAGLDKYINYWNEKGTEKQYIPNPLTWLNQGRWKDEIAIEDDYEEQARRFIERHKNDPKEE